MKDNNIVRVLTLMVRRSMEVRSKGKINSRPITVRLTAIESTIFTRRKASATFAYIDIPLRYSSVRYRCHRQTFGKILVLDQFEFSFELFVNNRCALQRSDHARMNETIESDIHLTEPLAGEFQLLSAEQRQLHLIHRLSTIEILAMTNQIEMPRVGALFLASKSTTRASILYDGNLTRPRNYSTPTISSDRRRRSVIDSSRIRILTDRHETQACLPPAWDGTESR